MAVRFVVNQAGIQSLVAPGGDVWTFTRHIGRDTSRLAKTVYAPRGTGALIRGIRDPEMHTLPHLAIATVTSTARHTMWVHAGTRTPIERPGGGFMPIHNPSRTSVLFYSRRVRGQRSNPFLATALATAFRLNMA